MCFSELYTRCQNIASALATSQITSNILDSEELAELLYIAYNRDEAEIYGIDKALKAGIIKKNKAARDKSKLMKAVNKIK